MSNHWLDRSFRYQPAATHDDGRAFHRRMQERRRAAAAAAAETAKRVQPIKRKERA